MENIGNRISTLRKAQNLTQKELAEKLHVSNNVVSKWELGLSEPNISMLNELASVFGLTLSEFLGEPQQKQQKADLNVRAYNYFKRNYMTIIQLILIWASLICSSAGYGYFIGYDIVISILPDYLMWTMLTFSLVVGLTQIFITLVRPGSFALTILKISFVVLTFTLSLMSYVFIGYLTENSQSFFVVTGIANTLMFVVAVLNLLLDKRVVKAEAPFKLGKLLKVLMLVFLSTQSLLVVGEIVTSAVYFYEVRTPEYVNMKDIYFNSLGEEIEIEFTYPDYTRHDELEFVSNNEKIAVVISKNIVKSVGYGRTQIKALLNGEEIAYSQVYMNMPDISVDSTSEDAGETSETVYGNSERTIAIEIAGYTNLVDFDNRFVIYSDKESFSIVNKEFKDGKLILTFKINSKQNVSTDGMWLYLKDKITGTEEKFYYLAFRDVSNIILKSITVKAGEFFTIEAETYPTECLNPELKYTFEDEDMVKIVDGKFLAVKTGQTTFTVTANNGISDDATLYVNDGVSFEFENISSNNINFYPYSSENNVDYHYFNIVYGSENAYTDAELTLNLISGDEDLVTLEKGDFGKYKYRLVVNKVGNGVITISSPWFESKRLNIYSKNSLSYELYGSDGTFVNKYDKPLLKLSTKRSSGDYVKVEFLNPDVANSLTGSTVEYVNVDYKTGGSLQLETFKRGASRMLITSQVTGEQIECSFEVEGILNMYYSDYTFDMSAGQEVEIQFNFEISTGAYDDETVGKLYKEITVESYSPSLLQCELVDTYGLIYETDDTYYYGTLKVTASPNISEEMDLSIRLENPAGYYRMIYVEVKPI